VQSSVVNTGQFTEGISGITFLSLFSSYRCLFYGFPACLGLVAGGSPCPSRAYPLLPGSGCLFFNPWLPL